MSALLSAGIQILTAFSSNAFLNPVLFLFQRNIGGFVADVTIREKHEDVLSITRHPVERGSPITDHAFREPSQLTVTVGWSNSSIRALANPYYVRMVYAQFLALQSSREPFTVNTGKRIYTNMLIERLSVETDEKTENALIMDVSLREVIIADTQTVTTAPVENMANPQATSPLTNRGAVNNTPINGTVSSNDNWSVIVRPASGAAS